MFVIILKKLHINLIDLGKHVKTQLNKEEGNKMIHFLSKE